MRLFVCTSTAASEPSMIVSDSRSPDASAYLKITFLISQQKHMLWFLKEPSQYDDSFEHTEQLLKLMGK